MHNLIYETVLNQHFLPEGVQRILTFLREKDFSPNGEAIVVHIFLLAKQRQKRIAEVIDAFKQGWEKIWKLQKPGARGDPTVGEQSRASWANICQVLGIKNPAEEAGMIIASGAKVVRTKDSTYRIGAADSDGIRSIAEEEKPLAYTRCWVVFLLQGQPMKFIVADGESSGQARATTSEVELITYEPEMAPV